MKQNFQHGIRIADILCRRWNVRYLILPRGWSREGEWEPGAGGGGGGALEEDASARHTVIEVLLYYFLLYYLTPRPAHTEVISYINSFVKRKSYNFYPLILKVICYLTSNNFQQHGGQSTSRSPDFNSK